MPALYPDNSKTGGDTAALPKVWETRPASRRGFAKFGADAKAAAAQVKADLNSFKAEVRECRQELRRLPSDVPQAPVAKRLTGFRTRLQIQGGVSLNGCAALCLLAMISCAFRKAPISTGLGWQGDTHAAQTDLAGGHWGRDRPRGILVRHHPGHHPGQALRRARYA